MADKKWMFDKSTKQSSTATEEKESPMDEIMEHSSASPSPTDQGKGKGKEKGKDSPVSSGFRDLDASCSDCANLSPDQSSCSKVELPPSFTPYNSICSKYFVPKDSDDSSQSSTSEMAPPPNPAA